MATVTLAAFNGCRKSAEEFKLSDAQQVEKAKVWYESQQKNQVVRIGTAIGNEASLEFKPNWENAKVIYVNGVVSVSTDIKTNLASKFNIDQYYALVIKNDNDNFDSRILNINSNSQIADNVVLNEQQLYKIAFTNNDLSHESTINASIKVYGNHFKNQINILYSANGKTILPIDKPIKSKKLDAEMCFDAYLVTRVYMNGVLVDTYQEYMGFEICQFVPDGLDPANLTGPGGGGYGSENHVIETETNSESISSTTPVETTAEGDVFREWTEIWRFVTVRDTYGTVTKTYYGHAVDVLKTKKNGSDWDWVSCSNSATVAVGTKPDNQAIVKDAYAVTFTTTANVQLTYHISKSHSGMTANTVPEISPAHFIKK